MLLAIEGLPEEDREVFELVRIQGLTHAEAAAVVGVSVKTVQRRLNRARLLLAEELADLRPGGVFAIAWRHADVLRRAADGRQSPRVRTPGGDARHGSNSGRSVPRLPGAASRGPPAVDDFPPHRRGIRGVASTVEHRQRCRSDAGPRPSRGTARGSRLPGGGACSATAAWASSTAPGTSASIGPSP